ncbi:TonB family protein [Phenylobacterium sp.]|uniref:TonB family protein n=1 Tax=Phenylobacterium sp. TaxID=1871053 RepID=UPI00121FEBDD|nr:TonB family protein [Phenylobacterium sp.]THD65043.1 MAG: TonB family protein [Phenylobacterium sp.]
MIETILMGLLKANLAAAAAAVLALALRKAVRGRLGARAAYALWLAPLLAAVAVLLPHPAASVAAAPALAPVVAEAETVTDEFVAAATPASGPDVPALLVGIWIAGALAAAGLLARRQARFVASLGRLEPLSEPGLFRAERIGVGPAVVGVLRPKVVAPADFESRYAPGERALILAHERAHLRAHDALANAAACAAQCLCWFNPLVHLAARLARVDQELACDAAVIGRFPDARRTYAELLLKTQLFTQPLPLGCHWPAGAEHPLKERIAMLKSPLPARAARRLGAAVAFTAYAAAAGLAWASQPAPNAPQAIATAADLAAIPNNGHLEPEDARKLWRPGLSFLCKPDENRELHNCRMSLTSFEASYTAADVQREWPTQAKKAGLTGSVTLQCSTDLAKQRLDQCVGYHFEGAAERPGLKAAFQQAALRVIAHVRLKANPGPDVTPMPPRGFYIVEFSKHPAIPGGPPANPPTTRFPDFLPGPPAKTSMAAPAGAKVARTLASYAPAEGPARRPVITKPDWIEKPTGADFAEFYPKAALASNTEGRATLHCNVVATGGLADCEVNGEAPLGQGFGDAALAMAAKFQMKPQTRDGAPTSGGEINIPIRFIPSNPEPGQPAPPQPAV